MSNLIEIKKRIAGIASTIKVTKVMQMIATAKIAKIKQMASVSNRYSTMASEILINYLKNTSQKTEIIKYLSNYKTDNGDKESVETQKKTDVCKNKLFILLTSDKGTCGNVNTMAFKEITDIIKTEQKKGFSLTILPVGKKAVKFLETNALKLNVNVYKMDKNLDAAFCDTKSINTVVNNFVKAYANDEFCSINIVYNKFKNIISCSVVNTQLLPIDARNINIDKADFVNIEETNSMPLSIVEFYIRTQIYDAYVSNLASIVSSRMNAMDNATKNGQEIINNLKIKYNKSRQANITSELSDIVSGFEAIS